MARTPAPCRRQRAFPTPLFSKSSVGGLRQIVDRPKEGPGLTGEKAGGPQTCKGRDRSGILNGERPDDRASRQLRIDELARLRHDQVLLSKLIAFKLEKGVSR